MGSEAVLDKQTGLAWARNADIAGKKMSWKDAKKFCQDIEIGNRKGWRLPTKKQMKPYWIPACHPRLFPLAIHLKMWGRLAAPIGLNLSKRVIMKSFG